MLFNNVNEKRLNLSIFYDFYHMLSCKIEWKRISVFMKYFKTGKGRDILLKWFYLSFSGIQLYI